MRWRAESREISFTPCDATTVNLTDIDCTRLEQLAEDDAILAVLAGSDANGCDRGTDARVPQNVVGIGWLLHPPGLQLRQFTDASDRLADAPLLVCIHHQLVGPSNLFSNQASAPNNLKECRPTFNLK